MALRFRRGWYQRAADRSRVTLSTTVDTLGWERRGHDFSLDFGELGFLSLVSSLSSSLPYRQGGDNLDTVLCEGDVGLWDQNMHV